MPFSVVQTIEKNQKILTTVPDQWVHNKLLFWPKSSANKLRRQEKSSPEASWEIMTCDVKRKNLKTIEEAQDEINAMSDKSDTETDEGVTNRRSLRKEKYSLPQKSFNELAKTLTDVSFLLLYLPVLQLLVIRYNNIIMVRCDLPFARSY